MGGVDGTPTNHSSRTSSSNISPGVGSRDSKSGTSLSLLKSKFDSCIDHRVNLEFLSLTLCNHVTFKKIICC